MAENLSRFEGSPDKELSQPELAGLYRQFAGIAKQHGYQDENDEALMGSTPGVRPRYWEMDLEKWQLREVGIESFDRVIVKFEEEYLDGVSGESVYNDSTGNYELHPTFQKPRVTIYFHKGVLEDGQHIAITDYSDDQKGYQAAIEDGIKSSPLTGEVLAPYKHTIDKLIEEFGTPNSEAGEPTS